MEHVQNFLTPFLEQVGGLLPGVLGALMVFVVGWLIAKGLGSITYKVLNKTNLDNRLFKGAKSDISPERFLSKLVYYVIMLVVLMVVLEMMGVQNVLDPIKDMVGDFVGFIPNLVAAGIIAFAGYIIATIVSEALGFASGKIDSFAENMGFSNNIDLSKIVKQIVFVIVFIPLLITAIDKLGLTTISEPATAMLSSLVAAIPKILGATIIVGIFFIVGKFVTNIVAELLRNLGADNMADKMGFASMIGKGQSLSSLVANVGFFFLMFTGIIQAVEMLEFGQLSRILNNLLELTGQICFGLVIMVVGNFISTIVSRMVQDEFLSSVVRFATLGLFLAIALRTMGIANDIVNLAFGLTLGAVAVAVALAFGLGGREAAGKQMEYILSKFRKEETNGKAVNSSNTKRPKIDA